MQVEEMLEQVRSFLPEIGAKMVYAEPVSAGETTVVPVASVGFGFGGGSGKGKGEGGGGGGGFHGRPAGYIEITPAGTRFVPLHQNRKILLALVAGIGIGYLAGRLRQRR